MDTKWKIFRVINTIEIVLFGFDFLSGYYFNPLHFHNASDYVSFALQLLFLFIITANCINNISLIDLYSRNLKIARSKKIFFWILFALFLLVNLFFGMVDVLVMYYGLNATIVLYKVIANLLVCIIGIYILINQTKLFKTIKKAYKESTIAIVDGIGQIE
jgi:hypothetical protein